MFNSFNNSRCDPTTAPALQILSDTHLEFGRDFTFPKTAPYLALLGDIGKPHQPSYKAFIAEQAQRFDRVLVLVGNHEAYGTSVAEAKKEARKVIQEINESMTQQKVILLDRTRMDWGEENIVLGCTLWSYIKPEQQAHIFYALNDFRTIAGFNNVQDYNNLHQEDLHWLEIQLDEIRTNSPNAKVHVLTHHAPMFRGTSHPQFDKSPISSAFATDLTHLIKSPVETWAFGHTHWSCDQKVGKVRVVSNAVGYPGESIKMTAYREGFHIVL